MQSNTPRRRLARWITVATMAASLAACGSDDDPAADSTLAAVTTLATETTAAAVTTATTTTATATATTSPEESSVTTAAPTESTDTTASAAPTADEYPSAIVSMSASSTETLYALGAGDSVIAVDNYSNYPPEVADKQVGLDAFTPNVEAIAALEPDLVITDGTNADLLSQLDDLGIAHWEGVAPTTLDEVYTEIEQLGALVGKIGDAAELVGQMQTDIDAALATLPDRETPLTYYHELDNTFYSVTSDTFIGAVYTAAGLTNVADTAGADLGPYPQLSAEFIIEANPDLIFLACTKYCSDNADTVAARPGWDVVAAVANGGVIGLDDDVVSRWGPRVVDLVHTIVDAVVNAPVTAGV